MINIGTTLRSPKQKLNEMNELFKIIHAYKKNKKTYFTTPPQSIIQYEEKNESIEQKSKRESPNNQIKKGKVKCLTSERRNLGSMLENWQSKQLFIKDKIVSENISKNKIQDPFINYCKTEKNKSHKQVEFLQKKIKERIEEESVKIVKKRIESTKLSLPSLRKYTEINDCIKNPFLNQGTLNLFQTDLRNSLPRINFDKLGKQDQAQNQK